MDTSKEYIRMCEKADEIQEARIPRKDDILLHDICPKCMLETEVHPNPMYMHTCEHCKWNGNYRDLLFIWLPRQDQLQEMVGGTSYYKVSAIYELCNRISSHIDVNAGKCSMEQLWLAFVMLEKYNKIWDGEEWLGGGE